MIILAVAAALFVSGKVRSDLVAICSLLALLICQTLTPAEGLAGFANSTVIMMVGLFVVGGGIFQTGLANMISSKIMALAGQSQLRLFLLVMIVTGTIGSVVSNTGTVAVMMPIVADLSVEDWHNMLGTNLDGVFNCTQEVLRRSMIKNHRGVILNISSMWGQVGASCEAHYSAAKAGVIGLTKALAKELGLSGIRVNCIAPGVVMTDMMKGFDDQTIAELKEETPLNTLGTPKDIADAAIFLCSDRAKFITGQVLGVNGGFVI